MPFAFRWEKLKKNANEKYKTLANTQMKPGIEKAEQQ
jgi:hypothetical protein